MISSRTIRIWSYTALMPIPAFNATCDVLDRSTTTTTKNSKKTAALSLFFGCSKRRRARTSAGDEISMADNLPEKQQKQRERHASYGTAPDFVQLMNAS